MKNQDYKLIIPSFSEFELEVLGAVSKKRNSTSYSIATELGKKHKVSTIANILSKKLFRLGLVKAKSSGSKTFYSPNSKNIFVSEVSDTSKILELLKQNKAVIKIGSFYISFLVD